MIYEKYRDYEYYRDIIDFLDNKNSYSDEEFIQNAVEVIDRNIQGLMQLPNEFFEEFAHSTREDLLYKTIQQIFDDKDIERFIPIHEALNISSSLKFGLEIETSGISTGKTKMLFDTNLVSIIMKVIGIPDELIEKIVNNVDFRQKNENNKWTISGEGFETEDGYT